MDTLNTEKEVEAPFRAAKPSPQGTAFPQHLRALAECSPDAIFITNFDSARFVDANAKACSLFGYSVDEFRKMTGRQLHDQADGAIVDSITRQLVTNSKAYCPSVQLRRKDGSLLWAELRSSSYRSGGQNFYVVFIRDISNQRVQQQELESARTALQHRENQLVQAARWATIGHLASCVAHEVNNPAAILQMNLEVLSRRLISLGGTGSETDPLTLRSATPDNHRNRQSLLQGSKENVAESFLAVDRIAATMRSLSRVAKSRHIAIVRVSLNEVVQEANSLLGSRLSQNADLILRLGQPDYFVGKKESWLLLLINLLVNAHQAISEAPGRGQIVIATGEQTDSCFLEVLDNGPGVAKHLSSAIFQPFVTTRQSEGAMGLGLSSCVEIARQHRATLTLISTDPGVGFRVQIPRNTGLTLSAGKHSPLGS